MELTAIPPPAWGNYVLHHGADLTKFWNRHLAQRSRKTLYILGKGFDPRMCVGIKVLLDSGGEGARDILVIDFPEGPQSPSLVHKPLIDANWAELEELAKGRATIKIIQIEMRSPEGRRIGSRNAAEALATLHDFKSYDDIVIDTSAMPRAIFFPLIAKAMFMVKPNRKQNLHIFVSENATLDSTISDEGVEDDAVYVYGFGGMDLESIAALPKVWIPLLGEGQNEQLRRIYDFVSPEEICPVLPSPSRSARRCDNLVAEYRELLFERLRVEPRNFIYAAERNPFEVYRQLRKTVLQYRLALQPLGGSRAILSAHSSKLMSLGALLVAHELRQHKVHVGVAHVETDGYVINKPEDTLQNSELFGLWLSGECYEA